MQRSINAAKAVAPNDPSIEALQAQLDQLENEAFQGLDTKLAAHDVNGADKDFSNLTAALPEDGRLSVYRSKILKTKFDLASKAFSQAVQSQDIESASTKLSELTNLIPDEKSLGTLHQQLLEAAFDKSSSALQISLSKSNLPDAKTELSKIQNFNIEADKTAQLSGLVSAAIKAAIGGILNRGQDALKSKDLNGATQALTDARDLDSTDGRIAAFQRQINDYKYSAGITQALKQVSADSYSDALETITQVMQDRPEDPRCTEAIQILEQLSAPQFKLKKEEQASGAIPTGNVLFLGRIIKEVGPDLECLSENQVLMRVLPSHSDTIGYTDNPVHFWRLVGHLPAVGQPVLVYGPVSRDVGPGGIYVRFNMQAIQFLPLDFLEQGKTEVKSALSK